MAVPTFMSRWVRALDRDARWWHPNNVRVGYALAELARAVPSTGVGTASVMASFSLYDIAATTGVRADGVEDHLYRLRDGRPYDDWRFPTYDPACNPLLSVCAIGAAEAGYFKRRLTIWHVAFNLDYRDVGRWTPPDMWTRRVGDPR